jgi:hypothetical protein
VSGGTHARTEDWTDIHPRQIDLFSISKATDIHGTKFDLAANPIASDGKITKGITTATYTSFVNMIDSTQLARFGLHNGKRLWISTYVKSRKLSSNAQVRPMIRH